MTKRFSAFILALMLAFSAAPAFGETNTTCTCCCNCNVQQTDKEDTPQVVIEKTPEELYLEWFDASWPLVEQTYNLSTWVEPLCFRYKFGHEKADEYVNADFLLLSDMREATKKQVSVLQGLSSNDIEDSVPNTYKFVQLTPTRFELISSMRESLVSEIPEKYEYIDSLICTAIDDLTAMRTSLVSYIQEHKTLENWTCPSNSKDNIQKLERILLFQ